MVMGVFKCLVVLSFLSAASICGLLLILNTEWMAEQMRPSIPNTPRRWWGKGATGKDNVSVRKFNINITATVLNDLKQRLKSYRSFQPLEKANFEYGFNADYIKKVVDHWHKTYDWTVWQKKLNQFDQYMTQIDGLQIHFIHVKPKLKKGQRSLPMILIHGWPGSIFEFYKAIPQLTATNAKSAFAFEVIIPSLPGYAWSQAPSKPGFGTPEAARVFTELMLRLGFSSGFYVQGGDWGSMVGTTMALMRPDLVRGVHVNMPVINSKDPRYLLRVFLGSLSPTLVGLTTEEASKLYPLSGLMAKIMDLLGYFHLQATRPDTVGIALMDSPAGLAGYILEKFSGWTNPGHKTRPDGSLTGKFTLDELLTNVMIYWVTGSIPSSMRFYKETLYSETAAAWMSQPVSVPTGIAMAPNELMFSPEPWCRLTYPNLIHYAKMAKGGHFLAMEEPLLFTTDVINFVKKADAFWASKPGGSASQKKKEL